MDEDSVEKLRLNDLGTRVNIREPYPSADVQRQPDGGSEVTGSQPSPVGYRDGSSESDMQEGHRADQTIPAPDYDGGLARRVTDCGYQPNTRRPDIGAVLKYELSPGKSSGPPVYEEEVGLLERTSTSVGRHGG